MKRSLPAKICFILLLSAIPASMLCVLWTPADLYNRLKDYSPVLAGIYKSIAPLYPAWPQFFAVQSVAALLLIGGVMCWLARPASRSPFSPRERVFPILLGLYIFWAVLSALWSAWPYGTRAQIIRTLPYFVLSLAAWRLCRDEKRWITLARVFAISVALQAALQFGYIFHLSLVDYHEITWRLLKLKLSSKPLFFANKNFAIGGLITGAYLLIAFAVRIVSRPRKDRPELGLEWLAMGYGLVGIVFIGVCFALSDSLAGYVALGVSAAAFAWRLMPSRRVRVGLLALALLLFVASSLTMLFSHRLQGRFADWAMDPKGTASLRVAYWSGAARMYLQKPVAGWGAGSFPAVYPSLAPTWASGMRFTAGVRNTHPHNAYLRVAAELGTVGLLLYLGILAYAFMVSYSSLRNGPPRTQLVGFALWAGALAYATQNFFSKAPMHWASAAQFWILIGVLASGLRVGRAAAEDAETRFMPSAAQWALFGVVSCLVAWGWYSWGVGSYASMVTLRELEADRANLSLSGNYKPKLVENYESLLQRARPRCLWPTRMFYYDYALGWYLTDQRQFDHAQRVLGGRIAPYCPHMLRLRLLLGRCAMRTGDLQSAYRQFREHIRRNPYDIEGYQWLANLNPEHAAALLEAHVYEKNDFKDVEKVWELISLYIACGKDQKARQLVERTAKELDETPSDILLPYARSLGKAEEQKWKLRALRRAFPNEL